MARRSWLRRVRGRRGRRRRPASRPGRSWGSARPADGRSFDQGEDLEALRGSEVVDGLCAGRCLRGEVGPQSPGRVRRRPCADGRHRNGRHRNGRHRNGQGREQRCSETQGAVADRRVRPYGTAGSHGSFPSAAKHPTRSAAPSMGAGEARCQRGMSPLAARTRGSTRRGRHRCWVSSKMRPIFHFLVRAIVERDGRSPSPAGEGERLLLPSGRACRTGRAGKEGPPTRASRGVGCRRAGRCRRWRHRACMERRGRQEGLKLRALRARQTGRLEAPGPPIPTAFPCVGNGESNEASPPWLATPPRRPPTPQVLRRGRVRAGSRPARRTGRRVAWTTGAVVSRPQAAWSAWSRAPGCAQAGPGAIPVRIGTGAANAPRLASRTRLPVRHPRSAGTAVAEDPPAISRWRGEHHDHPC